MPDSSALFQNLHTPKENISLFIIDASKNVTKNYLRKIFVKISKTFVIRLKLFMSLS